MYWPGPGLLDIEPSKRKEKLPKVRAVGWALWGSDEAKGPHSKKIGKPS